MKTPFFPLAIALMTLSIDAKAQPSSDTEANETRRIAMIDLIEQVRDEVDKEFILDPRLQGASVPTIETEFDYESLLASLRLLSFAAIETADQILIVPEQSVRTMPTRILLEDDSRVSDHEVVTRIIKIPAFPQNPPPGTPAEAGAVNPFQTTPPPPQSASMLVPVLRPMMSTSAQLGAIPGANSLVIVDRYDNVRRITAVIEEIIDQIDD